MKGYYTEGDYWGWLPDIGYMKFATEAEYKEAYRDAVGL